MIGQKCFSLDMHLKHCFSLGERGIKFLIMSCTMSKKFMIKGRTNMKQVKLEKTSLANLIDFIH